MKLCISFGLMQDLCAVSAIYQYCKGSEQPLSNAWPTITSICWFVSNFQTNHGEKTLSHQRSKNTGIFHYLIIWWYFGLIPDLQNFSTIILQGKFSNLLYWFTLISDTYMTCYLAHKYFQMLVIMDPIY